MSEWKKAALVELVDIRVSNVDKKIYPSKKLVLLCNYMDAYSNKYITNKINFSIGSADLNEINRFTLLDGDVVITKDSETPDDIAVPSVVIDNIPNLVCGYHLAILRPRKDKISGRYLMHKMNLPEVQKYFFRVASGSTRYGLTIGGIEKTEITLPPLPHQRKIARILTTVDNIIEKTEAAIAKYKAIKQGMMHDLFTRGIDVKTGKLRPKFEDAPELYKESELGWIPKEWEVERTEDISSRIWIGLVTTMTSHYVDNGVKLIRNNNIRDSKIVEKDIIYLDLKFAEQNKNRYLKTGDIVTVHTGDIGTSAIVLTSFNDSHGFATINTTTNNKVILNKFLCDYYNSPIYKRRIQAYATGDGRSNFNLYDYVEIKIPYPKDMKEQELISERIDSVRQLITKEESYKEKIAIKKQGLMQDLLTGKKEVSPDPEDYKEMEN